MVPIRIAAITRPWVRSPVSTGRSRRGGGDDQRIGAVSAGMTTASSALARRTYARAHYAPTYAQALWRDAVRSRIRLAAVLGGVLLVAGGCGSGAGRSSTAPLAEPTAGAWRTWVIRSPRQVRVPPPPPHERRPAVSERAPDRASPPAVKPWLEQSFSLVAARPKDPPAGSRAYALLSVAMYDAAVSSWYWKYVYRRAAPHGRRPDPSYPSDQAAIAGAASRVLAYLFPEAPAARFDALAKQLAQAGVTSGANYPSDARAGLALGRAVGDAAIARGRRDGVGRRWDGRRPHGRGFWEPPPGSLARPVEPLAGTWRTWILGSGRALRPTPPPAFGSPEFRAQARAVLAVSRRLTARQRRIARYWAGGEGTPLPPGIWNQAVLAYIAQRHLSLSTPRSARVFALLNVAMADAGIASWDTKYAYWTPRPENAIRDLGLARGWRPLIPTPFFPSFPSGHATYSGAAGEVLAHLFPADAALFRAKARVAAVSRVYGGIHYPMDGDVGLRIGRKIGRLVVSRATRDGAER